MTLTFFKWANPASFSLIFGLFKQTIQFLTTNQCEKCHVHPVYGTEIRTHNLSNMSCLSQPRDQGSRPMTLTFAISWNKSFYATGLGSARVPFGWNWLRKVQSTKQSKFAMVGDLLRGNYNYYKFELLHEEIPTFEHVFLSLRSDEST